MGNSPTIIFIQTGNYFRVFAPTVVLASTTFRVKKKGFIAKWPNFRTYLKKCQ